MTDMDERVRDYLKNRLNIRIVRKNGLDKEETFEVIRELVEKYEAILAEQDARYGAELETQERAIGELERKLEALPADSVREPLVVDEVMETYFAAKLAEVERVFSELSSRMDVRSV